MIKTSALERGNIVSITGAVANDYDGQVAIVPAWKRGMSNLHINSSSGDYDGGDRVIGYPNGYEIDGDLLFTVGWGDGFAVRRLNDDGTLTKLFHDNNFLWRDTGSTYDHYQSVAIDKINKLGVVMTYNVDGYTTFDYSGLMNGGTTFVKHERPTHANPQRFIGGDSGSINLSSAGLYYTSGLVAAGEWIYAGEYDARHYQKYPRRNLRTGEEQILTWESNGKTGTANDDRNGYRHTMIYDEVNDRVFYFSYYNASFMMVENASTADPKLVWCDMGDAGAGDDAYEQGLFIPDPVNQPNIMLVGASSRLSYIDIEPCQTGTRPTILNNIWVEDGSGGTRFGNLFRSGPKYQSYNADGMDRMPGYTMFCSTSADRGRNMLDGWIDFDNMKAVGVYRHNNTTEDTTTNGRGRSYRADYSQPLFRMRSANGTPWWIKVGYGYDGHSFKIWDDSIGNGLIGNWEVVYGTYTLDSSANIDFVHINKNGHYIPSECALNYYVSNNNGSTWEHYTSNGTDHHQFNSSGTQLRIKYTASGNESKSAYKMSNKPDSITYGTLYESVKDVTIPYKVSRVKIRGRKF